MTDLKEQTLWKEIDTKELCKYKRFPNNYCLKLNKKKNNFKLSNFDLYDVDSLSFLVDYVAVKYLLNEFHVSRYYKLHFAQHYVKRKANLEYINIILGPTKFNLIDYAWNERVYIMVREKCELDRALSWLSTLGGAFSALGDYYSNCAETAGKISFHQLKLGLRLKDPNILSRCRLYLSLSLIQQQKFKLAKAIIMYEHQKAINSLVTDDRLVKMCRGIWSKLQYEYLLYKKNCLYNKKINTAVKI